MRAAIPLLLCLAGCASSQDVCPADADVALVQGDVTLTNTMESGALAAQGCVHVTGTLTVTGSAASALVPSLQKLVQVDGDLLLQNLAGVKSLDLPSLRKVGGKLRVEGNAGLTSLGLGALVEVGDTLSIADNGLVSLDLGVLAHVGDSISINNGSLEGGLTELPVALPALVRGGYTVSIATKGDVSLPDTTDPWSAVNVSARSLRGLGGLVHTQGLRLLLSGQPDLELPVLEKAGRFFASVTGRLSLPKLAQADDFTVSAVKSVDSPALASCISVSVESTGLGDLGFLALVHEAQQGDFGGNRSLPDCDVVAFINRQPRGGNWGTHFIREPVCP